MGTFFYRFNKWLSGRLFLVIVAGLSAGYVFPVHNSPGLRIAATVLFAYMTFVTSMGTSFRHFLSVLKMPRVPLWILFLTHVVTPLIAWGTGLLVYPDAPYTRLGYLIATSLPIGLTSIIWTALTSGNVAVSLVAVTLDTIVAPVLLPAMLRVTVGRSFPVDYGAMMVQLMLMVTLPSIAAMIWHDRSGSKTLAFCQGIGGVTSKLGMITVIYMNSAVIVSAMAWSGTVLKAAAVTIFLVIVSFALGLFGSFLLKERSRSMEFTMMYNVGIRNVSIGLVLALTYFPPPVAVPVTLFILFQQPVAALLPHLFKREEPSVSLSAE